MIDQKKLAEQEGYTVNKYGYVLCEVQKAFGPYSKGDKAGFVPSDVHGMLPKGYIAIADPVDPDSTIDEDATAEAERDRQLQANILASHQARAERHRSTQYQVGETLQQNRYPVDVGPDPKVQDFSGTGDLGSAIPETRRRPVREIEQDPASATLSPASATLSGKPLKASAATGADARVDDGVYIPDGWRDSHADTRKHLASQIAGKDVKNAKEADEIISAEEQKRSSGDTGSAS